MMRNHLHIPAEPIVSFLSLRFPRKLSAAAAIMLILLAGCAGMAPSYTRPEAPVPEAWPGGFAYKATEGEPGVLPADTAWRDFILDERLQKVVELALINNRDLRIAMLNVERTQALYRIQRAELLPTINAGAIFSKERVPGILSGSGEPSADELFNVNVSISAWEIDLFGRIRNLRDAALEEYLATDAAHLAAKISLIAEVANTYLTLASDRELLMLAQDTLRAQQETYRLIQRRYEVGASSELDVRQARTRLESARVDISRYAAVVAADQNALTFLVGSPVPEGLLPQDLDGITMLQALSPGLPADVLQRRPDVRRAENLLRAAHANIGAARAAFFPRITLTTSIGTTSDELSGLFTSGSDTWSFIPRIVLPIFDARTWAAHDVARVDREIRLNQYEKTIQIAFREVADALAQRGTLSTRMLAQQSLVEATAESYRLSEVRYKSGIESYLGVLDAQRSLYAAQQNLIGVRLLSLANLVTLFKVLGGGVIE